MTNDTMRVAMYYNNSDIRLESLSKPAIGPGEVLLKVISSGICGSDVMEWYRIKKAPLVLGHEVTGEIVAAGEGVDKFKVGDRIATTHHVPCNSCHYCLHGHHSLCNTLHSTKFYPGGFAEYLRLPAINVERGTFKLPAEVSYDVGTFVEPLGCAVRGQRLAGIQMGQSVLVLGSGMSGLLHVMLAKANGAGRVIVTDINDYRLQFAKKLGADAALNAVGDVPAQVKELTGGGVDLAIVCTAAPAAFEQAMASVDRGGTVLLFALHAPGVELNFDARRFMLNGTKLMSTYAAPPLDMEIALELIRSGQVPVEKMITHHLPLAETGRGFQMVVNAQDSMKIIIQPQV